MWLELGDNVLVDLGCFSHFHLCRYEDTSEKYAVDGLVSGTRITVYRSADVDDVCEQFNKIRRVLMEEQRQWAERLERVRKID